MTYRYRLLGCKPLNIEQDACLGQVRDRLGDNRDHVFITVSETAHSAFFIEREHNAQEKRNDGAEKFARESVDQRVDTADRINRVRLIVMDAIERQQNGDKGKSQSGARQQSRESAEKSSVEIFADDDLIRK